MGMSAARPNNASTVSTAFVARKVHTIAIGGPGRRSLWQRMGLEPTTLTLPVFQYYPEDKACSVWLYETDKSTAPHQKLTWFGVKSLVDGQKVLEGNEVSCPRFGNTVAKATGDIALCTGSTHCLAIIVDYAATHWLSD